ncbi:hypothetical protein ACJX0J_035788, partial [Zea mays]
MQLAVAGMRRGSQRCQTQGETSWLASLIVLRGWNFLCSLFRLQPTNGHDSWSFVLISMAPHFFLCQEYQFRNYKQQNVEFNMHTNPGTSLFHMYNMQEIGKFNQRPQEDQIEDPKSPNNQIKIQDHKFLICYSTKKKGDILSCDQVDLRNILQHYQLTPHILFIKKNLQSDHVLIICDSARPIEKSWATHKCHFFILLKIVDLSPFWNNKIIFN